MSKLSRVFRSLWKFPKRASRLSGHVASIQATLPALDQDGILSHMTVSKWQKYIDQERWLPFNVTVCNTVGLIDAPSKRILDIGCGSGLFLFCARHFGHCGIGIDVDDPLLADIATAYNVDRRVQPVRSFVPLDVPGKFDVVTGIATQFDREFNDDNTVSRYWNCADWRFFFENIETKLTATGRVFLIINKECYLAEPREYYDDHIRAALWHGSLSNRRFLFDRAALRIAIDRLGSS